MATILPVNISLSTLFTTFKKDLSHVFTSLPLQTHTCENRGPKPIIEKKLLFILDRKDKLLELQMSWVKQMPVNSFWHG